MKPLDRFLQKWRIAMARPYVPQNALVLDVGTSCGVLFTLLQDTIQGGIGIDPDVCVSENHAHDRVRLIRGTFPANLPPCGPFDAVTLLAVVEHIPAGELRQWPAFLAGLLRPGGRIIITVPSPWVDTILAVLKFLRVIDAMALEEHHGFQTRDVMELFGGPPFRLLVKRKFQLGLNNLFVFEKITGNIGTENRE